MENSLHPWDKRVVIIRTCHLVTMSVQTKGSHRGRDKHQMSYGDEQGKKFSSIAIGPSQGHWMVKGRFMLVAWLAERKAYFSRHAKTGMVYTGHVSKYLFPN